MLPVVSGCLVEAAVITLDMGSAFWFSAAIIDASSCKLALLSRSPKQPQIHALIQATYYLSLVLSHIISLPSFLEFCQVSFASWRKGSGKIAEQTADHGLHAPHRCPMPLPAGQVLAMTSRTEAHPTQILWSVLWQVLFLNTRLYPCIPRGYCPSIS